ncbi:MAG: hypothetical protein NT142_11715 [Planctomycetota bacterium]|nr:hypothetical protein [Planctomycetota bacterium]
MVFKLFHRQNAKFAKEEKTLGKTQASGERKLPDSRELRNQILESYGIKFSRATESKAQGVGHGAKGRSNRLGVSVNGF